MTIADDPAVLTINIMDPIATERDADPGSFVITRGGGDLSASLTVSLTLGGSATQNTDYQFVPTSVAIPASLSSVLVPVVPIFDLVLEGNETVTLQLNPTANYLVDTPASAALTIVDFIDAVFRDQFE